MHCLEAKLLVVLGIVTGWLASPSVQVSAQQGAITQKQLDQLIAVESQAQTALKGMGLVRVQSLQVGSKQIALAGLVYSNSAKEGLQRTLEASGWKVRLDNVLVVAPADQRFNPEGAYTKSVQLLLQGRPSEALKQTEATLSGLRVGTPLLGETWYLRALAQMQLGQEADAIGSLRMGLSLEEDPTETRFHLVMERFQNPARVRLSELLSRAMDATIRP